MPKELLTIGELADRAGVATSALRYYEREGLIQSERTEGGQRRFHRDTLRRVSFIRASQNIGISLEEIHSALATLPDNRTPNKGDWAKIAKLWKPRLDAEIEQLVKLRDKLSSCIGCGCLSLQSCALYNPDDQAARKGSGARYLMGDSPPPIK